MVVGRAQDHIAGIVVEQRDEAVLSAREGGTVARDLREHFREVERRTDLLAGGVEVLQAPVLTDEAAHAQPERALQDDVEDHREGGRHADGDALQRADRAIDAGSGAVHLDHVVAGAVVDGEEVRPVARAEARIGTAGRGRALDGGAAGEDRGARAPDAHGGDIAGDERRYGGGGARAHGARGDVRATREDRLAHLGARAVTGGRSRGRLERTGDQRADDEAEHRGEGGHDDEADNREPQVRLRLRAVQWPLARFPRPTCYRYRRRRPAAGRRRPRGKGLL